MCRIVCFVLGLIILLFNILSCNNSGKKLPKENIDLNSQKVDWKIDTFDIFDTIETTTKIHYELFSNPTLPVQETVNSEVLFILNNTLNGLLDSSIRIPIANYEDVKEASNRFRQAYLSYSKDNNWEIPWELELHISILRPFNEIVTLYATEYLFQGGFHGHGIIFYYNYSVSDGRMLSLKDIFIDMPKLNSISEKYFRYQNMNGDMKANFNDYAFEFNNNRFHINDNFFLTPQGLKIQYNEYEIAPYVMGSPVIDIPWVEIESIIKMKLSQAY